jgi:hypothetical protein
MGLTISKSIEEFQNGVATARDRNVRGTTGSNIPTICLLVGVDGYQGNESYCSFYLGQRNE